MCSEQSKVYVVIPVFNRKNYTQKCLECLITQTYDNMSIVVVDDGSTDGTSDMIASEFPAVKVLSGDGTLWWTGAINVGIKEVLRMSSREDFVLIINDDVLVRSDYVEQLIGLNKKNPKSIIGSVEVDDDKPDIIKFGGTQINWITAKSKYPNRGKLLFEFPKGYYIHSSSLIGRGTLFPSEVFRTIGLYDDTNFQQCGDTELPVRASHRGYKLLVSYSAIVYNQVGSTTNFNTIQTYRLRDFREYFFDIKSNNRVKYKYYFAKNTAQSSLQFLLFCFFNIMRTTYHFFARVRLGRFEEDKG